MKRKVLFKVLFSVLLMGLFPPVANAQQTPGIFYQVTRKGLKDTSYLFGTYHLVKNSYLDELPAVQQAFKNAKGIVVEIVMDTAAVRRASAAGMMQQNLSDLLEPSFRDTLDKELKSIGAGVDQLNNYKPMNVVLTLSIVNLMKNNGQTLQKYTGLPLDAYFARAGAQGGKSITALETIEEQMDVLFNGTSIEAQLEGLRSFIRNKNEMVSLGNELVKGWFAGDLTRMHMLYEKTLALSGEEDRLLKARNLNWMKVLPHLINKQSQFIAVGALHLGGSSGLVELLRKKGYTVTAVNTKL